MLPSSRRERSRRWLGVMLSLTSWLAAGATGSAQDQASGQRFRRENHTQSSSQPTPLERLRNRSAQERWQRHRDNERWSPADPFQRDWPVEDATQPTPLFNEQPVDEQPSANAPITAAPTATSPTTATAEAPAVTGPPAPAFPWAGNAAPEAATSDSEAATSDDNPFTPLDNELWQNGSDAAVATEPTPAARSTNTIPVAPQVATEVGELLPTPAIPANPFADSRWVELGAEGDGPALGQQPTIAAQPISSSTTSNAATSDQQFGIAPLPETQYGSSDSANPSESTDGLIAPGGIAALDDPSELAPQPMMQEDGPTNSAFLARIKPIRDIVPYFQPNTAPVSNNLPTSPTDRGFVATDFDWAASNVYHNPLYFEDVALERYGHTHHHLVQPFVSAGKFGAQFIALPYKMAIDPVWDEEYVLGYYRPGELAPFLFYQIPWNWRAATTAAGTYTGLIFLFP